ncbi:MAG: BamA/TamA family outer membrane protein [Rhodospirillaceae bacterium]|nr:BamA/TamA family outer membrane protein [Rhodospirillaceae bacterium]
MRRYGLGVVCAALACVPPGANAAAPVEVKSAAPVAATVTRYRADIVGAPGKDVLNLLRATSQLLALKDRPPATIAALRRRIADDEQRFSEVMESQGYYDAQLESNLTTEGDEVAVEIAITPGARFLMAALDLRLDRDVPGADVLTDKSYDAPLKKLIGKPARAEDVIKAEDDAIAVLRDHGFPFARRGDRETAVNHDTHDVKVILPVKLGPHAVFGDTLFNGLDKVHEGYMKRSVPWTAGTLFDYSRLEELRRYFVDSGLFASVKVAPADTPDIADGAPLDVDVAVAEGAARSVTIGGNYARDQGFGGSAGWTHRNLFGGAEKLDLKLDGTQIEQTAGAAFEKPNFLRRNQALKLSFGVKHSDTDAFAGWSSTSTAGLERKFGTDWIVSAGVSLDVSDLTQNGVSGRSFLAGLPLTVVRTPGIATRSISTFFVDQTEGWRLTASATPYIGEYRGRATFLRTEAEGDYYIPFDERQWTVLAARLKAGTIVGSGIAHVPVDKRFYAGGGGSVRGFGYQLVSPVDADGTPLGGRGLLESSLEMRFRIMDTVGVVPFIDAGGVSPSPVPGKDTRFAVGTGIGVRYYTDVGPLRVDFALPVNPRAGIDKGFQFYLSFGQAF